MNVPSDLPLLLSLKQTKKDRCLHDGSKSLPDDHAQPL